MATIHSNYRSDYRHSTSNMLDTKVSHTRGACNGTIMVSSCNGLGESDSRMCTREF